MSESARILSLSRIGEGPRPVALLHGFLGSGRNLSGLARRWSRLDPNLSLFLPDLTGHGVSPALPQEASLDDMARDLLATLLVEVGKRPVDLVGHSLGGRVALAALALKPERVQSVSLIDIAPGPIGSEGDETIQILDRLTKAPTHPESREEARNFLLEGGIPAPTVEWLLTNLIPSNGSYSWRIDRFALASFRIPMSKVDLWPVAERFADRITSTVGGNSPYVSEEARQRFRELGVPVQKVEGAGHFVHMDKPNELLEFLSKNVGSRH